MSTDDPDTGPVGEALPAQPPPEAPATDAVGPQDDIPGSRRRRLLVPLAAAAAAAVALTGIGVGVAVTRGSDGGRGDEPPALRLVDTAEAAGADTDTAANSDSKPAAPDGASLAGLTINGDLPTRPDRAAVWTLPDRVPTREAVTALARTLGVTGQPERISGGWEVRQGDLILTVQGLSGQPWQLNRTASAPPSPPQSAPQPAPRPAPTMDCHVIIDGRRGCGQVGPGAGGGRGSGDRIPEEPQSGPGIDAGPPVGDDSSQESTSVPGSGPAVAGAPAAGASGSTASGEGSSGSASSDGTRRVPSAEDDQATSTTNRPAPGQPRPAEPTPAESAIRGAAVPLLDALGHDGSRLSVRTWPGHGMVSADPVVGGLPVEGLSTRLEFDASLHLEFGNGWLATPAAGREYPLVDAKDALERTMSQERTCDPCASPVPGRVRGGGVVTGAELGLDARWEDGVTLLLVPSWVYDVRYGATKVPLWRIAVDPRYLAAPSGTKGRAVAVPAQPMTSPAQITPAPGVNAPGPGELPSAGNNVAPVPPDVVIPPAGPKGGARTPAEPPATR